MARCADCGLDYNSPHWVSAIVPHEVWKQIAPDHGELCISCMAQRIRALGLTDVNVYLFDDIFTSVHRDDMEM